MQKHLKYLLTLLALGAVAAFAVAGCGSDHASSTSSSASASATDTAFAADMIPHHEGAVAMAKVALERSSRPQIKALANNITVSQNAEIQKLKAKLKDLEGTGRHAGHMGMSAQDMGMEADMPGLESARPFDRTFIAMMIPHHQGAIRMAKVELAKGKDPELRAMAKAIIAAQTKEIAQMRAWRSQWYPGSSPTTHQGNHGGGGTMMDGSGSMMD